MKNYIGIYDYILTAEECNHYINLIENNPKRMGHFHNIKGQLITNPSIKLSEDINISTSFPEEIEKLLYIFSDVVKEYEEDINQRLNISDCEHFVGRVYRKNTGHYNTHIDCYSAQTIKRTLSVLLYLNTVRDGGELVFPDYNKKIQPREGRVVIFPSYWMYRHGANIPLDTDRYMIRTFMNLIPNE